MGCTFEQRSIARVYREWHMHRGGYVWGPYGTRHEAVESALELLGVELKGSDYRHGNKGAADVLPDAAKT